MWLTCKVALWVSESIFHLQNFFPKKSSKHQDRNSVDSKTSVLPVSHTVTEWVQTYLKISELDTTTKNKFYANFTRANLQFLHETQLRKMLIHGKTGDIYLC